MSQPRVWLGAAHLLIGCDQGAAPVVERSVITLPCTKAVAEAKTMSAPIPPRRPLQSPPPPRPVPVHLPPPQRWMTKLAPKQQRAVRQACEWHAQHPCQGPLLTAPFTAEHPDPTIPMLAILSDDQQRGVDAYCGYVNAHRRGCSTPLVVAFESQPIVFATSQGAFNFDSTPVSSDWPTAVTPWIALDRDGDGAITRGAELFGDATPLAGGTARDGFAALASLDANGDGVLDAHDPMFASLLLWADRDGDRKSTPAELRPLAELVTSLPLAHSLVPRCTDRGDCEGERGVAHWRDVAGADHTGAVVDVYLSTSPSGR